MIKKILFVVRTLDSGGISKVTLEILSQLKKEKGIELHLLVLSDKVNHKISNDVKIHIYKEYLENKISLFCRILDKVFPISSYLVSGRHYSKLFKKYLSVLEKKEGDFDKIFLNGIGCYAGLWKIQDERLYFCSHSTKSMLLKNRTKVFRGFGEKALKKMMTGKKMIAVSKGIAQDWKEIVGRETFKEMSVIYNPLNFNTIKKKSLEKVQEKNYIIHVGRFSKEKRHDLLLKAYKKSKVKKDLILLGEGPLKNKTISLAKKMGLEKRVLFKGFQSNPYKYIANASFLVLCSDYEGLPTVLLEALACGVPVVSTNCKSGPQEIMVGELSKFLTKVGDDDDLAEKIQMMDILNVKINEDYLKKFDPNINIKKYLNIINS